MRVVVIGGPGSGKTTLARVLATRLQVEHIELDAVLHAAGGTEPSCQDFRSAVLPRLSAEDWVVDGWHERKLGTQALERADVIVFLDPPLPVACWRLVRRTLPEILLRKKLWNGNRQTWRGAFGGRDSLLGYAFKRYPELRRRVPALMSDPRFRRRAYVHLRSVRETQGWLKENAVSGN